MRPYLQYIADTVYVEDLLKDDRLISIAQDGGIGSSIIGALRSYIFSIFDKDRPIASLTSLFTSGLLWSLKSKKLAILYTLAGALGFDWKAFWGNFGGEMVEFAKEIISSGKKSDAASTNSKVNEIATNAVSASFTGSPDPKALANLAQTMDDTNKTDDISLSVASIKSSIIKTAGIKSKIAGVLIRVFGWIGITILGIIGITALTKTISDSKPKETADTTPGLGRIMKLSPNVPQDLFSVHRNDMSSIWIEHGDINTIGDILMNWILSAYPQFQKYADKLKNSSSFESMVSKFQDRNKLASGMSIISIPRPYQRKIDIVSSIVRGFLSEHSQPGTIHDTVPSTGTVSQ